MFNLVENRIKMDELDLAYHQLEKVSFGIYSSEELKKLSVIEVRNPITFDALGHSNPLGLYDKQFGNRYCIIYLCPQQLTLPSNK